MERQPFLRRVGYLFVSLLILGLAFGTTLGSEPGAGDSTAQVVDEAAQASRRLERIRAAVAVHQRQWERLMEIPDVVGSGVGLGSDGEPIIKVFTARHGVPRIPARVDGVPVHSEVSGRIYALRGETCKASEGLCTPEERWPLPVPIGVSVGHPAITAGTIAARVSKGSDVYILSNNHVLANINEGNEGDRILQPGAFDGGTADDAIATLTEYQEILFCDVILYPWLYSCSQTNTVDAAIAASNPTNLGFSTPDETNSPIPGYGAPSRDIHPAYGDPDFIGDEDLSRLLEAGGVGVKKYGRTTGLTTGTVDAIDATVEVCYDEYCDNLARFTDQLIITPGTFSAGGDSGSLVVTNDSLNQPVGLLFAGSDTVTIINRIDFVLQRFGVTIDDGGDVVEPRIDVAVTGIDVPTPVSGGPPVTVTVTVENRGTDSAGGFDVILRDNGVDVGMQPVESLSPNAPAKMNFSWAPTTPGLHILEASHLLAGDENPGNNAFSKEVNVLLPPGGPQLQVLKVMAYTDRWTTVELNYDYGNEMVVVCSPNYNLSVPGPAIVRVKNAAGSSFEVGLGRPWAGTFGGEDFSAMVHCMVIRQGVYTVANGGAKMEAVKIPGFTASDHVGSWSGLRQFYQKSYTRPVVVGQVISPDTGTPPSNCPFMCDADWSVFWSRGTAVTNPPSSSALYVGRHTGEDQNGRTDETLAYVVIEKGSGRIEGKKYLAGLGADTVRGMENAPPYTYSLSGLATASAAIVSQAGMDAGDGGWPVLYGPDAVKPARLRLAIDEDWYFSPERRHTTEQVFYIVFE